MGSQLTLYTRPGCILCAQVRGHLEDAQLTFREVVVTAQDQQNELLRQAGAVGFPALFVGNRYVGGFTHVVYLMTRGRLRSLSTFSDG
jgi:glutaredoxin